MLCLGGNVTTRSAATTGSAASFVPRPSARCLGVGCSPPAHAPFPSLAVFSCRGAAPAYVQRQSAAGGSPAGAPALAHRFLPHAAAAVGAAAATYSLRAACISLCGRTHTHTVKSCPCRLPLDAAAVIERHGWHVQRLCGGAAGARAHPHQLPQGARRRARGAARALPVRVPAIAVPSPACPCVLLVQVCARTCTSATGAPLPLPTALPASAAARVQHCPHWQPGDLL